MGIKYDVHEDFFNKWSHEMAYVLGYFYADGSMEDASYLRGKYVRVLSVEKDVIEKIKKWLGSDHKIISRESQWPNGRTGYLLRIGSHKLYNTLYDLGLYPNKSLTVQFPNVPKKYLSNFVRGFFDGDGCVHLVKTKNKNNKILIKKLSVIFTSGSNIFLQQLGQILKENIQLKNSKVYNSHRSFQLRYSTFDSIKIFKFLYKKVPKDFYLRRKFDIFLEYFKVRPLRVDGEIKRIINTAN